MVRVVLALLAIRVMGWFPLGVDVLVVTVKVEVPDPPVMIFELHFPVAPAMFCDPSELRVTVPVKASGTTVTVKAAAPPGLTV